MHQNLGMIAGVNDRTGPVFKLVSEMRRAAETLPGGLNSVREIMLNVNRETYLLFNEALDALEDLDYGVKCFHEYNGQHTYKIKISW